MSVTTAGALIVVIVVGNSLGRLFTAYRIGRTGRYKLLTIAATLSCLTYYIVILLRWSGNSWWADTWYLILGGLGMGCTRNTTFVHPAASVEARDMAVARKTGFVSQSVGGLVSGNVFNVLHNVALIDQLNSRLHGYHNKNEV